MNVNPFKAVKSVVGGMFASAKGSDVAAPVYTTTAVIATPLVAPVVFLGALAACLIPKKTWNAANADSEDTK